MLELENSPAEMIKLLEEEASRLVALAETADTYNECIRLRDEARECREQAARLREALA
ncbi:hypothetical protein [Flaviflagellibacter deserti]|jgi:hypothetical protein|uniref:Uncharacterized protein n=1 Tax=Flaviflagellibacter deserti TaxID=2267266 RepID=A0ABV9YX97_9HYPH